MLAILENASLEQAERIYQQGRASEAEIAEYLRTWNAGPHFTQAVLTDGRIKNFDPERSPWYRHLYDTFGVRA